MRFPNALLGTSKAGARVPGSRNVSGVPGLQLQLRSRRRLVAATLLSLAGILVLFHLDDAFTVHFRDLGYITRPIWDKAPVKFTRVYTLNETIFDGQTRPAAGEDSTEAMCRASGLEASRSTQVPRVVDAIIFSLELDLLEIRLRELMDVVDTFVVVESNVTFTGHPKELAFANNRQRFDFISSKIVYSQVSDLHSYDGMMKKNEREGPMDNEIRMRSAVSSLLDSMELPPGSIVIQSDADEIPKEAAIRVLKHCSDWGDIAHLGMPTYLYSFEFPMQRTPADQGVGQGHGPRQWRATAKRYKRGETGYTHSRVSNTILERAGWHCTFCFKRLEDFVFKMTSYSHNDRVTSKAQLDHGSIQRKICQGKDVFDMLPEAYDFSSLIKQIGPVPKASSTAGLPRYLLEHPDRFSYLLPGGCKRRDEDEGASPYKVV